MNQIFFPCSLDKLTSFFLHAFPTMTCHLFRWRIVDHSMKFKEDSYMGWEAHFLYPFGMYVAWQIGFLIMTGNFFLKLDEILFPDKNCPNFYLQKSREYFCGFFVHFFYFVDNFNFQTKIVQNSWKIFAALDEMKVENSDKIENGEKKKENWEKYWKLDKKKLQKKFHEYLDNFCLGLEIKVVNKIENWTKKPQKIFTNF